MIVLKIVFILSVLVILYAYGLYPIGLCLLPAKKSRQTNDNVAVKLEIITKIDTENFEKACNNIQSMLKEYPNEVGRIHVMVSEEILIEKLSEIKDTRVSGVLRNSESKIVHEIIERATENTIMMWDCNCALEAGALLAICDAFMKSGAQCVSGIRKKIDIEGNPVADGAYTKYENVVRVNESKLGALSVVDNGFYAFKKDSVDDVKFVDGVKDYNLFISTVMLLKKKIMVLDRNACIIEVQKETDNIKSHIESAASAYQNYFLNIKNFGLNIPTFVFVSHKVFKLCVPFCMIILLVVNVLLIKQGVLWQIIMLLQIVAYVLFAIKNIFKIEYPTPIGKILNLLCYFIEINWSYILGFGTLLSHKDRK